MIESENEKARKAARREFNEQVRELVAFVKKRDKRVLAHAAEEAARRTEAAAKAEERCAGARGDGISSGGAAREEWTESRDYLDIRKFDHDKHAACQQLIRVRFPASAVPLRACSPMVRIVAFHASFAFFSAIHINFILTLLLGA